MSMDHNHGQLAVIIVFLSFLWSAVNCQDGMPAIQTGGDVIGNNLQNNQPQVSMIVPQSTSAQNVMIGHQVQAGGEEQVQNFDSTVVADTTTGGDDQVWPTDQQPPVDSTTEGYDPSWLPDQPSPDIPDATTGGYDPSWPTDQLQNQSYPSPDSYPPYQSSVPMPPENSYAQGIPMIPEIPEQAARPNTLQPGDIVGNNLQNNEPTAQVIMPQATGPQNTMVGSQVSAGGGDQIQTFTSTVINKYENAQFFITPTERPKHHTKKHKPHVTTKKPSTTTTTSEPEVLVDEAIPAISDSSRLANDEPPVIRIRLEEGNVMFLDEIRWLFVKTGQKKKECASDYPDVCRTNEACVTIDGFPSFCTYCTRGCQVRSFCTCVASETKSTKESTSYISSSVSRTSLPSTNREQRIQTIRKEPYYRSLRPSQPEVYRSNTKFVDVEEDNIVDQDDALLTATEDTTPEIDKDMYQQSKRIVTTVRERPVSSSVIVTPPCICPTPAPCLRIQQTDSPAVSTGTFDEEQKVTSLRRKEKLTDNFDLVSVNEHTRMPYTDEEITDARKPAIASQRFPVNRFQSRMYGRPNLPMRYPTRQVIRTSNPIRTTKPISHKRYEENEEETIDLTEEYPTETDVEEEIDYRPARPSSGVRSVYSGMGTTNLGPSNNTPVTSRGNKVIAFDQEVDFPTRDGFLERRKEVDEPIFRKTEYPRTGTRVNLRPQESEVVELPGKNKVVYVHRKASQKEDDIEELEENVEPVVVSNTRRVSYDRRPYRIRDN